MFDWLSLLSFRPRSEQKSTQCMTLKNAKHWAGPGGVSQAGLHVTVRDVLRPLKKWRAVESQGASATGNSSKKDFSPPKSP